MMPLETVLNYLDGYSYTLFLRITRLNGWAGFVIPKPRDYTYAPNLGMARSASKIGHNPPELSGPMTYFKTVSSLS